VTIPTARVLYIDDDEALRRLAARALERRGFAVSVAAGGAEGVALSRTEPFDLIAIDHYMPGQDGLETLAQLRDLPDPPPLIYVTGSDESRIAVAALKAGADDYVVKVVGDEFFDLLASSFAHALEQVGLRRAKEAAEAALKSANAQLETIVARQAVLLREVNHRVANSLQLVSALVQMQANLVTDPAARGALIDTQHRLKAITQVHRKLYTSEDVEAVDIKEYLAALVEELEQTWSTAKGSRRLTLDADPVMLNPDKAVSLGVIVSELVTNACKYAYGPEDDGAVRIAMRLERGGEVELTVEDDGPGLGGGASAAPGGTGMGQKVIAAMAASLDSSLDFDPRHKGVRAVLRFAV
jgi:two-component sensor histidine kinase